MPARGKAERSVTSAYGEFLGRSFCWTHFGTVTFRYPTSSPTALSYFKGWIKLLELDWRARVGWFASVEEDADGASHVHFLLRIDGPVNCLKLIRRWRSGYARIVRYNPQKPGSYYVAKRVSHEDAEYDFNYPYWPDASKRSSHK